MQLQRLALQFDDEGVDGEIVSPLEQRVGVSEAH